MMHATSFFSRLELLFKKTFHTSSTTWTPGFVRRPGVADVSGFKEVYTSWPGLKYSDKDWIGLMMGTRHDEAAIVSW